MAKRRWAVKNCHSKHCCILDVLLLFTLQWWRHKLRVIGDVRWWRHVQRWRHRWRGCDVCRVCWRRDEGRVDWWQSDVTREQAPDVATVDERTPAQLCECCAMPAFFIARQHSNAEARYWYSNSVRLSVFHIPVLYRNVLTYHHTSTFFSLW